MALQVYTNDSEWVIAQDLDDARLVWCELVGVDPTKYSHEDLGFEPLPADTKINIWCESDGSAGEIQGQDCTLVSRTSGEWVALRGRGFLCTTEQ